MLVFEGAGRVNFGAPRALDHLNLLSHNRGAHRLKKHLPRALLEIETTGMLCRISVRGTVFLLALASNTCECEFCLTVLICTDLLGHLYAGARARHLIKFIMGPYSPQILGCLCAYYTSQIAPLYMCSHNHHNTLQACYASLLRFYQWPACPHPPHTY